MPAGSPIAPPNLYAASRLQRHLRTVGILWVVYGCFQAVEWLMIMPFLHAVFRGGTPWMRGGEPWIYAFHPGGWLLHFISVVILVRVVLSVAAGVGLLTRQPWGRIFAIVVAFLTLLKPILGTILAIYTLCVLLSSNAGQEYDALAMSRELRPL